MTPADLEAVAAASALLSDADALTLISKIAATRPNIGRAGADIFEFHVPSDDPEDHADGITEWTWYVAIEMADQ